MNKRIFLTVLGVAAWLLVPIGLLLAAYIIDPDPAPADSQPLTSVLVPTTESASVPVGC